MVKMVPAPIKWSRWFISFGCALALAILITKIFSSEREVKAALKERFPNEAPELVVNNWRYRGVICGTFRLNPRAKAEAPTPFIYVSKTSVLSPPEALLIVGEKQVAHAKFKHLC